MNLRFILIFLIVLLGFNDPVLALWPAECRDIDFVTKESDYIVEVTVERVETKWNDPESQKKEGKHICTYLNLKVDKYIKGTPLPDDRIQMSLFGGCIGDLCETVLYSAPTGLSTTGAKGVKANEKVRLYLTKRGEEFQLVCEWVLRIKEEEPAKKQKETPGGVEIKRVTIKENEKEAKPSMSTNIEAPVFQKESVAPQMKIKKSEDTAKSSVEATEMKVNATKIEYEPPQVKTIRTE